MLEASQSTLSDLCIRPQDIAETYQDGADHYDEWLALRRTRAKGGTLKNVLRRRGIVRNSHEYEILRNHWQTWVEQNRSPHAVRGILELHESGIFPSLPAADPDLHQRLMAQAVLSFRFDHPKLPELSMVSDVAFWHGSVHGKSHEGDGSRLVSLRFLGESSVASGIQNSRYLAKFRLR